MFNPMSPFFIDEFIFNEDDEPEQERNRRREWDDDSSYNPRRCPDCDGVLVDSGIGAAICCRCYAQFRSV